VLFPHVEFSPEFKAATSEQTTTEQSIGTFENQRTKSVTDAQAAKAAKIRDANAQAHKIRADADAETSGIIAKAKALRENPKLLCYMIHKGWDGKMPEITNGSSPLPFAEVCKL
jgi:regulator of protease activity HflC (stomatin/prohibitin superfamily)